jgi:hypothetical protein
MKQENLSKQMGPPHLSTTERRYVIVSEADLSEGRAKLSALHQREVVNKFVEFSERLPWLSHAAFFVVGTECGSACSASMVAMT